MNQASSLFKSRSPGPSELGQPRFFVPFVLFVVPFFPPPVAYAITAESHPFHVRRLIVELPARPREAEERIMRTVRPIGSVAPARIADETPNRG